FPLRPHFVHIVLYTNVSILATPRRIRYMKLSDIRATLQDIGVSPVKTLGQNFLHDRNLARWIVEQAEVTPDDYIVEIGPGLGALTELLLQKRAHVLAIEKTQDSLIFCASDSAIRDLKCSTLTRSTSIHVFSSH